MNTETIPEQYVYANGRPFSDPLHEDIQHWMRRIAIGKPVIIIIVGGQGIKGRNNDMIELSLVLDKSTMESIHNASQVYGVSYNEQIVNFLSEFILARYNDEKPPLDVWTSTRKELYDSFMNARTKIGESY